MDRQCPRNHSARPRPSPSSVLAVLLALVAAGPAVASAGLPLPLPAGDERGAYRTRDLRTGAELGRAEWIVQQETRDGRPILDVQEYGREAGRRQDAATWSEHTRLDLWGAAPALTSTRVSRDPAGTAVKREQRTFAYDLGAGEVVTLDPRTGRTESRSVRLTGETITPELLPALLRLLPQAPDRQMHLDLVTRAGWKIRLRATLAGRERVRVPAGSFECLKIELVPTDLVGMLALQFSTLFMWVTVTAPHFWVKYEGPDGVESRRIVRELVRFEAAATPALSQPPHTPPPTTLAALGPARASPGGGTQFTGTLLGYLALGAAILFQIGVEGTLLFSRPPATTKRRRPEAAQRVRTAPGEPL